MKKFISILLALAMIAAMNITVFAAENTSFTIDDAGQDREYLGYRLLDLTTSLKGDTHHPEGCNGVDHSDDCYNFAYTVNPVYRAILQAETLANGRNELWVGINKPTDPAAITDAQILEYLSYQSSDNGEGNYLTMRQVADRIYREILAQNLGASTEKIAANNDNIAQGYWLFADVTGLDKEDYQATSLVMVDTKGQGSLTIKSKTALPTVEKKVKDIEDSEDSNILDNAWHIAADHDIGDAVPFKLTATLPSNAQYYTSYEMIFHDTTAAGLTVDADSFVVYMYDTKHKADVDTDLNDATKVVTDFFTVKTTGLTDDCTFEVSCENVFAITGVTKDTAFVVYYEATLNENAVTGTAGNANEVYLEFSNNPYGDGTGTTPESIVKVFTYQLVINKVDSHGHELAGAGFTLYKKDLNSTADGYLAIVGTEQYADGQITFTWKGLDDGDYLLKETHTPEGYNTMADIAFSISATHTENEGTPELTALDGGLITGKDLATGTISENIVNNTGAVLPETGAEGTVLLIGGGALLVMVAGVFMITRKKMSIYED